MNTIPTLTGGKEQFIDIYRVLLQKEYPWAADKDRLDKFMISVKTTLYTQNNTWNIDSSVVRAAWRGIGMRGKPTYKALKALPE